MGNANKTNSLTFQMHVFHAFELRNMFEITNRFNYNILLYYLFEDFLKRLSYWL